jgi:hypothetical protein
MEGEGRTRDGAANNGRVIMGGDAAKGELSERIESLANLGSAALAGRKPSLAWGRLLCARPPDRRSNPMAALP